MMVVPPLVGRMGPTWSVVSSTQAWPTPGQPMWDTNLAFD